MLRWFQRTWCGRGDRGAWRHGDDLGELDVPKLWVRRHALPSLHKGFELPVLEAMACGMPVVTSDRSALPEVAGDAALLVDPESPEAIEDGMRRALQDDTYRADLRRRGFDRARAFRWEVTARQTVAVYREALAQH